MDRRAVYQTCPPYTSTTEYEPNTCVAVCPTPLLSDYQIHVMTIVNGVFGHVAIFCCLLIIVSYLTHPWKSSYPRSSVAWLQFPLLAVMVVIVLGVWVGWDTVSCDKCGDKNNGYTWIGCWFSHWSWCWVGGWLAIFGALSATLWYNLVAVGILQSISAVRIKLPIWMQATSFHVVGTVLPFLYTAALAMADELNPSGGYGVCFVSATKACLFSQSLNLSQSVSQSVSLSPQSQIKSQSVKSLRDSIERDTISLTRFVCVRHSGMDGSKTSCFGFLTPSSLSWQR